MMRTVKAVALTGALLLAVGACGGDSDTAALERRIAELEKASAAAEPPRELVEPEPTPLPSPAAAATPAAAPAEPPATVDFVMPNLVGANLQDAQNTIQELGVFYSISHDMLGSRNQVLDSNWQVCEQEPAPGTRISGPAEQFEGTIDFGAVKLTESCP